MALQTAPAYLAKQADGVTDFQHPIELMRNLLAAQCGKRSGAFKYGDFNVTSTGSGMGINIAAGSAFLQGVESNTQGGYFAWSNASEVQTFGAASGSTRYDTVLLRVADIQYGSISGAPRAYWSIVAGAAGAGAPRADSYFNSGGGSYNPGAWLRIADVRIDPGDTTISNAKITMIHNYIAPPGGQILCLSTNRPGSPVIGDRIYEVDTKLSYQWDGTAWRMIGTWRQVNTLSGTAASVSFTVPSTINHLRIAWTARGDTAATTTAMVLRVNGNSGAIYSYNQIMNLNSGTSAAGLVGTGQTGANIGNIIGANGNANRYAAGTIDIPGWSSPHATGLQGIAQTSQADPGFGLNQHTTGFLVDATGPWTSVTLLPGAGNFTAGSQFIAEGIG
jgi:hypothetical protein